jgi:hypothetical protein
MTIVMRCEEKDRLVGYLYDECSAAERSAVEAHLSRCAICAAELDGLRGVRTHLAGWKEPRIDLGFRITRDPVAPVSHRSWTLPAWAQVAAAVLVLAAGAGLANLQMEYGSGGVTLRTGWGNAPGDVATKAQAPAPQVATVEQLRELEQRLRAALAASTQSTPPAAALAGSSARRTAAAGSPELTPQVRAIVAESEERQRKEFAFRLAQAVRDLENQRSTDLVRIEQNLRQLEGVTGEQVQGQHEMMNYLRRVSSSPRP